jgi:hypothetical protein
MAGIGDLDLSTLDFGNSESHELIKSALSEGQTAYREVAKVRDQKAELLGEKKGIQEKYRAVEEKLRSKGLSIEALDTFDPSAGSEEQMKRFQEQIEQERKLAQSTTSELAAKLELAEQERKALNNRIEASQIKQAYNSVTDATGVNSDFADDLFLRLSADGVKFTIDPESGEVRGKRSTDVVDYSPDVLLTNLKGDPKYQKYFMGKFGGGSGTNPNGGKTAGANPFAAESLDLTEQSRLYRENPTRAMELKKMAGG